MRRPSLISMAALAAMLLAATVSASGRGLLDRSYRPLAGKQTVDLRKTYGGDVVLIVNTASKCGYTPQFEALESMHRKYSPQGFAVLGFPSGDFNDQEYKDEKQIQEFCTLTYGVKFPMFQKVHVVGPKATPLYKDLAKVSGTAPKWNFHKYLLGRDGKLIASWGSKTTPDDPAIVAAIERALKTPRTPVAAKAH
jgi:glutathione peroxidase